MQTAELAIYTAEHDATPLNDILINITILALNYHSKSLHKPSLAE